MATLPLRPCSAPGCPALVQRGRCPVHARAKARERPDLETGRLYRTKRWAHLRQSILAHAPLCRDCQAAGRVEPATEAHHAVKHHGDLVLFFDATNLVGLCETCHARRTRAGE